MVARTWLQHALPMPFGLKLAEYAASLAPLARRLRRLRREALALQFGGAAGTLAALGDNGLAVAERLAQELNLPLPEAPWHTHRDRIAEAASVLRDPRRHLRQDRARRLADDADRCRRSLRAGRRRPRRLLDHAAQAQPGRRRKRAWLRDHGAATRRDDFAAQVQDHERSAGPWHAEWPTLPQLMLVTSGALAAIVDIAEGLEVDAARMRSNLDATHGLIMAEAVTFALADKIGKSDAHHLIEAASKRAVAEKKHLRDVLAADSQVTAHLDARENSGTVRADGLSRGVAGLDRPAARQPRPRIEQP